MTGDRRGPSRTQNDDDNRVSREIEVALTTAGFIPGRVETLPLAPPVVCVLAIRGGSDDNEAADPATGDRG
jgi:hypothetical protein